MTALADLAAALATARHPQAVTLGLLVEDLDRIGARLHGLEHAAEPRVAAAARDARELPDAIAAALLWGVECHAEGAAERAWGDRQDQRREMAL